MGFANADLFSSNENNRDKSKTLPDIQGPPLGFDIMCLALADRNMQIKFGLKMVWES